ncbi:hypothetical protein [[Eubacterium] hominis]|uniref:hypothetical protein n=1 Tax=[Eubacterium] hominis TaxID=2764325 RepID=UPI003A4D5676
MQELKRYHPFVISVYVFTFLMWNTLISHPFIHVMILLLSWMLLLEFDVSMRSTLRNNLLFILLTTLSNPIVQHRGVYVLFTIWNTPITLESLAYGADLGCMLSGIINLFRIYSHMIQTDQILYMMTRISPNVATVCSLSMIQLSRLQKQYHDLSFARSLMVHHNSFFAKIKENIWIVSSLITWLMETSVETSLSMRSRGYGIQKRSCYQKYKMERRDRLLLGYEVITIGLSVYASMGLKFWWYPTFYAHIEIGSAILLCVLILLYCALPFVFTRKETALWEDIESTSVN